ncbi:MAG: hypothetical protein S4CHLAM102_05110 [Chlamydiia bacterium]|nr:hypothetical protein [Chlamydiia bacterium]
MIAHSVEETFAIARKLSQSIVPGKVIILSGDLGAGKTTFSKGLIAALTGVDPDSVSSPTFTYMQLYPLADGSALCHFDLYRLSGRDEFEEMGFYEYLNPPFAALIEWPDRLDDLAEVVTKERLIHVRLSHDTLNSRKILIEGVEGYEDQV